MDRIYYIILYLIVFLFFVVLIKGYTYNKNLKKNLLNILRLNTKNYLKNFVNMANKKNFKTKNIIDLIKINFDSLKKEKHNFEKTKAMLDSAFDFIDEGILITNKANKILYINKQTANLFKITNINEVISNKIINTNLKWLIEFNGELNFIVPEKYTSFYICGSVSYEKDFIIYKFTNMTEYKKLDYMSKEFISYITHELKTPLTSIIGFSETLKEVEEEDNRQIFYDIINKEAIRLNNLISDVLIFSEIEDNNDITKQKIHIKIILEEIKKLFIPQTSKKNFKINIFSNKIVILNCEKYLYQIFINIIDNSIKHSLGTTLNIKCYEDNDYVYVEFIDDGVGIPEMEVNNIFNRFYKVSNSKSKSKGTGLGLAIVLSLIKKINGNIEVFNNNLKGVTFKVCIPK